MKCNRVLLFVNFSIVVLCLLSLGLNSIAFAEEDRLDPFIPQQAAIQKIDELVAQIDQKIQEKTQKYGHGAPSEESLAYHFRRQGVGWASRYIKTWAGWEYVDWQRVKEVFYLSHKNLLTQSKYVIWDGRGTRQSNLKYLERGLERLSNVDREMDRLMDKKMFFSAKQATILDKIHELQLLKSRSPMAVDRQIDLQIKQFRQQESEIKNQYAMEEKFLNILRDKKLFSSLRIASSERIPTVVRRTQASVQIESNEENSAGSQIIRCEERLVFSERTDVDNISAQIDDAFDAAIEYCPGNTQRAPAGGETYEKQL